MNDIKAVISILSASERTAFVNHLRKRNKRKKTKNIQLFTAIIKGKSDIIKSTMTTNAFYVLKKRLMDRLVDFAAGCIIENEQSVNVQILKRLILSRKLFSLKQYKVAFQQLKNAERLAQELLDYHLLNEIYQTYILHSYHVLSPPQSAIFLAYEKNQRAYTSHMNLSMVYAQVRSAFLNLGQNNELFNLDDVISKSFNQFGISSSEGYTFKSLSQIAEIIDISGSHQRNYFKIDLFFEKHIEKLQGSSLDTERQVPDHIKLLYLVAHIYFRKKDFQKSIVYLKKMKIQMNKYTNLFHQLYFVRYTTLLGLNLNFSGRYREAEKLLDDILLKSSTYLSKKPGILQAILTRIVIHFQQEEFFEAKEKLALFWQQDSWHLKEAGQEWLLNKKFIEVLLAIELGNTNYVDSLLQSLFRKRNLYFQGAHALALPFLKLVEIVHKNPEHVKSEIFATKVESTFNWKPSEEEDLFFMSFYAWLKSKMTGIPLYKLTLSFLDKGKHINS